MRSNRTTKLTTIAMLSALAYIVMLVGRVPIVLFLKYDPKDVIITIGGLLYGPIPAMAMALVVSLVEMFTVSDTWLIGFVMNVLSTCAFACTASFIYKRNRSLKGAAIGLGVGIVLMVVAMMLWNYLIVPLYMTDTSRSDVAAMLVPVFLPFNLLKGILNGAFTMLLYKPVVRALRKANLSPPSLEGSGGKRNIGAILVSLFVLVSCILVILVMNGKI